MKILAKPSFARDLKKINPSIQAEIHRVYEAILTADNFDEILHIKKMVG